MPIKWSALEVSEAMDEVEEMVRKAEPFLAEAEARVGKATGIMNLPQYMSQRLQRLIYTIQYRQNILNSIATIRDNIPKGAVAGERQAGRQQSLGLDTAPCKVAQHDDFDNFDEWMAQQMKE
jgi:hypothetical protein